MSDLIEITNGELTARINPLGAELWSLTDGNAREYMTDADPAFWGGHAPLLFPIVGSLNGDVLRLDGREYALPRHGFARRSLFAPVHVEG
ncbi:MAG: aldose 1-epimerase family protein, partial [Novosphingobium sp.]|nr:aldose 1-epimerase family protein [Novosphingobium sp.]